MGSRLKISKYILQISVYLLIPYLAGYIVLMIFKEYWFPLYPYMIILFIAMGIPFFFAIKKSGDANPRRFVNSFLITSFFKLMLSMLLIIVYVWFEKGSAIPFVITYFVFYIVLSVCEIKMFGQKTPTRRD